MDQTAQHLVRQSLTRIGELAAHPAAFGILLVYGGLWFIFDRTSLDWHGVELGSPDWSDRSHSLAFTLTSVGARFRLHGMLNAYWEPLRFQLPPAGATTHGGWRRWIDTSLPSPDDIVEWEHAPVLADTSYLVQLRSIVFLVEPVATGIE